MEIVQIPADEVNPGLLDGFERRQEITLTWQLSDDTGRWTIVASPRVEDWSEKDKERVIQVMQETAESGGLLLGSIKEGNLLGFLTVDPTPTAGSQRALELSNIYVSAPARSQGLGTRMFLQAAEWAQAVGAHKLLINAPTGLETQGFFGTLGCKDAAVPADVVAALPDGSTESCEIPERLRLLEFNLR